MVYMHAYTVPQNASSVRQTAVNIAIVCVSMHESPMWVCCISPARVVVHTRSYGDLHFRILHNYQRVRVQIMKYFMSTIICSDSIRFCSTWVGCVCECSRDTKLCREEMRPGLLFYAIESTNHKLGQSVRWMQLSS